MARTGSCRLDDLGRVQFERLCHALIEGVDESQWQATPTASVLALAGSGPVSGVVHGATGPTLVVAAWRRQRDDTDEEAWLRDVVEEALGDWSDGQPRTLVVLTNSTAAPPVIGGVRLDVVDASELSKLVFERADLRLRMPSLLGICDASAFLTEDISARSTAELGLAAALARVFVPTRAYAATLAVLEGHGFAVLTGPPEMGKTAIARMIGLAKASEGWEFHECIRPDELWERFGRDRAQVFVADDAFGSTEYRPETAERWAVELDRVLHAMDDRHWLIWTSRPAPLKAGLRRIHREHGVERFPQPAEVQVDASDLEVEEKALILFRHARNAQLPQFAREAMRTHGWHIVSHEHFTPERIRRFVIGRALQPDALALLDPEELEKLIAVEIREPTTAMASSLRALAADHRALLVALLDVPPGPVPERELAAAVRRHSSRGFARHPSMLLDRLTDQFVHVGGDGTVRWVHPSWRDLVIEELASDSDARKTFLHACSVDGLLLALSTGGGSSGTRAFPLVVDDADWDAIADRLASLLPELDAPATTRLLGSLAEAVADARGADATEVEALATLTLERLARLWDERREAIPVGLLGQWLELRSRCSGGLTLPELAPTWIERHPSIEVDPAREPDVGDFDEWLTLVELLHRHAPDQLRVFGFPDRQHAHTALYIDRALVRADELPNRHAVIRTLQRIASLMPELAPRATDAAVQISEAFVEPDPLETYVPRRLSPGLRALLASTPPRQSWDERVVVQVLRDL